MCSSDLTAVNSVIPALMAGNAVLLKHAAQTLLVGDRFQTAMDKAGLPKGLFRTLTLSHDDTVKLIAQTRGEHLRLEDLPLTDQETYVKVFHSALTSGVFQFESQGMRDVLRRYQPNTIEDLTALNALWIQETFEKQFVLQRIEIGNAQGI